VMANPSGSPHDLRDTLAFAAAHGILPEVTAVSLDRAPDILAAMAAGTARGRSVITF
jgi:alcohol dehydrogenase, propanol-preferring